MRANAGVAAILFLGVWGCSGSAAPPEIDVSGVWLGPVQNAGMTAPVSFIADATQSGAEVRIRLKVATTGSLQPLGFDGNTLGLSVEAKVAGKAVSFRYRDLDYEGRGVQIDVSGSATETGSGSGSYAIRGVGGVSLNAQGTWSGSRLAERSLASSLAFVLDPRANAMAFDGQDFWATFYDSYHVTSKVCRVDRAGGVHECILDQGPDPDGSVPYCPVLVHDGQALWCIGNDAKARKIAGDGTIAQTIPLDGMAPLAVAFDGAQFIGAEQFQLCRYDGSFVKQGCVDTPFVRPWAITASGGGIWLLDWWPARIYRLDAGGAIQTSTRLPAELLVKLYPGHEDSGSPIPQPEDTYDLSALVAAGSDLVVAVNKLSSSNAAPTGQTIVYAMTLP